MYDVVVIGSGPAGLAAAAYTQRQQLTTLVIAPDLAGKAQFRLRLPWIQGHETIIGDEVDARRAEADIGIAGADHAGADRTGHVVTRTARDRKVGAKAKAPRQFGPQRTASCSALDQIG